MSKMNGTWSKPPSSRGSAPSRGGFRRGGAANNYPYPKYKSSYKSFDSSKANFFNVIKERLSYTFRSLAGQTIIVNCSNGVVLEGILIASDDKTLAGVCLTLRFVRLKDNPKNVPMEVLNLPVNPADDYRIDWNDLAYFSANDSKANQFIAADPKFKIDADIARQNIQAGKISGRALETPDSVWLANNDKAGFESLDGDKVEDWDQFKTNAEKFGVVGTYNENLYTTPLDKSQLSIDQIRYAERTAREIESKVSSNIHIREERNQVFNDNIDDENRFSSVSRDAGGLIAGKYQPPHARLQPAPNQPATPLSFAAALMKNHSRSPPVVGPIPLQANHTQQPVYSSAARPVPINSNLKPQNTSPSSPSSTMTTSLGASSTVQSSPHNSTVSAQANPPSSPQVINTPSSKGNVAAQNGQALTEKKASVEQKNGLKAPSMSMTTEKAKVTNDDNVSSSENVPRSAKFKVSDINFQKYHEERLKREKLMALPKTPAWESAGLSAKQKQIGNNRVKVIDDFIKFSESLNTKVIKRKDGTTGPVLGKVVSTSNSKKTLNANAKEFMPIATPAAVENDIPSATQNQPNSFIPPLTNHVRPVMAAPPTLKDSKAQTQEPMRQNSASSAVSNVTTGTTQTVHTQQSNRSVASHNTGQTGNSGSSNGNTPHSTHQANPAQVQPPPANTNINGTANTPHQQPGMIPIPPMIPHFQPYPPQMNLPFPMMYPGQISNLPNLPNMQSLVGVPNMQGIQGVNNPNTLPNNPMQMPGINMQHMPNMNIPGQQQMLLQHLPGQPFFVPMNMIPQHLQHMQPQQFNMNQPRMIYNPQMHPGMIPYQNGPMNNETNQMQPMPPHPHNQTPARSN